MISPHHRPPLGSKMVVGFFTGFNEFETHDSRAEAMTLLRIVILYALLPISQL